MNYRKVLGWLTNPWVLGALLALIGLGLFKDSLGALLGAVVLFRRSPSGKTLKSSPAMQESAAAMEKVAAGKVEAASHLDAAQDKHDVVKAQVDQDEQDKQGDMTGEQIKKGFGSLSDHSSH